MDFTDTSSWLIVPLQIMFVDLLLGADNALLIALACRKLPPAQVKQAAMIGVLGAIVMRLLLATVATAVLLLPVVKLLGALALFVIALNLSTGDELEEDAHGPVSPASSLAAAAVVILVADLAMSLDNVLALAAIANGNLLWIAVGVALSIPILGLGGVMLAEVLRRATFLVAFGAALLGWIAGGMAVSDPLVDPWVSANAPGLGALAPVLGALFVFLYGRYVAPKAPRAPKPAPAPAPKRAAPPPPAEPRTIAAPIAPAAPELALRLDDDELESPGPAKLEQPRPIAKSGEERIAIIALLVLAVCAATMLLVASYFDTFD